MISLNESFYYAVLGLYIKHNSCYWRLITKYARIKAEKSFTVYLSTLLVFEYLYNRVNI